jgi:hypothetical protein
MGQTEKQMAAVSVLNGSRQLRHADFQFAPDQVNTKHDHWDKTTSGDKVESEGSNGVISLLSRS